MFKNVASQKVQLFAFDITTGAPKTGDAGNITAYVSKDHGAVTVLTDTSAAEMDATNAKGVYVFDVAQAETNADELTFSAKSSTSNVSIVPRFISTNPPSFTAFVTPTGAAVNATQIGGQTASAAGTVTFPGTIASSTNITAGTITTVTNLTNAPTAGDLTATMKASINTEADTALADYDAPTNAEMVARTIASASYATAAGVDDLPTNAELATALGAADDAVLAQVALVKTETDKIAAVKAKTDQLAFGVTNTVNANITHVNEKEVGGDGEPGTEWGPA